MKMISVRSDGVRYLDNLVSLDPYNDGICYSGFARTFDITQAITFPITEVVGYHLVYYDHEQLEYVQQPYTRIFSEIGTFSNFMVWNRALLTIEFNFMNANPEFIYLNRSNYISIDGDSSLHSQDCVMWVPMLHSENGAMKDYVGGSFASIINYNISQKLDEEMVGPQMLRYSDELLLDDKTIYIRDKMIDTNWVTEISENWVIEEIYNEKHVLNIYDRSTGYLTVIINNITDVVQVYTHTGETIKITSTSFDTNTIDIATRGYFTIYKRTFTTNDISDAYARFLESENILTTEEGLTGLTSDGLPIII